MSLTFWIALYMWKKTLKKFKLFQKHQIGKAEVQNSEYKNVKCLSICIFHPVQSLKAPYKSINMVYRTLKTRSKWIARSYWNILISDKDFRLLVSWQAPFRVPVRGQFEWPAIVPQKSGGRKRFFGWSDKPPRPTIEWGPIMMRTFFYLTVVDLRLPVQPPAITGEAAMHIHSTFCI